MSSPTHNAIYKARTYTDDDGQQRNAYATIGVAWCGEDGTRIRLDTSPVNWDGTIYLREREEGAS